MIKGCIFSACTEFCHEMKYGDLVDHLKNHCLNMRANCPKLCGTELEKKQGERHFQVCVETEQPCKLCHGLIKRKDQGQHNSAECKDNLKNLYFEAVLSRKKYIDQISLKDMEIESLTQMIDHDMPSLEESKESEVWDSVFPPLNLNKKFPGCFWFNDLSQISQAEVT